LNRRSQGQRLVVFIAAVFAIAVWVAVSVSLALALPAGASFSFLETWEEYGTQASIPGIAPYVIVDPNTSSIVCGQMVPWVHPGQNLTGCYLKIVPNGHGGENPGPTVATIAGQLGNPSQTLITYAWFRAEVAPTGTAAIFLWCDSTHAQGVRGTDQTYLALQSNGRLQLKNSANTNLGNSGAFKLTFGTALTNWYLLETIIVVGVSSTTAWQQGSIALNIYKSNGLRVDSFGCNNCATNANNSSYIIDQIALDAEFDDTIIEDFGPTSVINPGTNGAAAFVGPQYSWYTKPSGDSTPLQYAVTGVTHHWQAMSDVPLDSTKYVSTATQGNQDAFTANMPTGFGTITQQALVSFQVSDGAGVRLGTDLSVSPGGMRTLGNQCALVSAARPFCESFYANASMPTKIGLELGW